MRVLLYFFLLHIAFDSSAVVKRHDIPSENYLVDNPPEYLIDMPYEGHGVLISPQWIVTVAHTIFYDYTGKSLTIASKAFDIEEVHIHPNYTEADKALFEGDAAPLMNFLKSRSDIALIKLSIPVSEVKPVEIYAGANEKGKQITVFGRGATGDGNSGENSESKSIRKLNHFNNVVDATDEKWLQFKFDKPPYALPLEGMHGAGDSGGASVVFENGTPYLVGLSSWQVWSGDLASFKGGLYGTTAYQVRVTSYRDWIMSFVGS